MVLFAVISMIGKSKTALVCADRTNEIHFK